MSAQPAPLEAQPLSSLIPTKDIVASDPQARLCRSHRVPLEERGDSLLCPACRRRLGRDEAFLVVNQRTGRVEYEATLERGAVRMAEGKEKVTPQEHEPKSATLMRAKFNDGGNLVLFIRLTKEPRRLGGDPFRIRWQQGRRGDIGRKGTTGGVAKTCPDEAAGQKAFKAAVRAAEQQGWTRVPMGRGSRRLQLKPIPAPPARKRSAA